MVRLNTCRILGWDWSHQSRAANSNIPDKLASGVVGSSIPSVLRWHLPAEQKHKTLICIDITLNRKCSRRAEEPYLQRCQNHLFFKIAILKFHVCLCQDPHARNTPLLQHKTSCRFLLNVFWNVKHSFNDYLTFWHQKEVHFLKSAN